MTPLMCSDIGCTRSPVLNEGPCPGKMLAKLYATSKISCVSSKE